MLFSILGCESTLNLNSRRLAEVPLATLLKIKIKLWLLMLRQLITKCLIVAPNTHNLKKPYIFTIVKCELTRPRYVIND